MIDEKKLIEEVEDMMSPFLFADEVRKQTLKDVIEVIENQPKADEWTPVEVVLPAECEHVQVSYIDYSTGKRRCDSLAYLYNGLWYWQYSDPEYGEPACVEITAWRPLGEPYMEEQE